MPISNLRGSIEEPFFDSLSAINKKIANYNRSEKIETLISIYLDLNTVNYSHSDTIIQNSPIFRKKFQALRAELQEEFAAKGIKSMRPEYLQQKLRNIDTPVPDDISDSDIERILETMPQDKVDKLATILTQEDYKNLLKNLYSEDETGYEQWQAFLRNFSIEFLGGSNSKIFLLKNISDPQNQRTLKVNNNMGHLKTAEIKLRNGIQEKPFLTPLFAERKAFSKIVSPKGDYIPSLELSSYCPAGDISTHWKKDQRDSERLYNALEIFTQMATILKEMQDNQVMFTDMKNSNWLLQFDDAGKMKLLISDTKSFLDTNKEGSPIRSGYVYSSHMFLPEWRKSGDSKSYASDSGHVYMLGKNLYQYLSKTDDKQLLPIAILKEPNFDEPIFKTTLGQKLQTLITSMIKTEPTERISMQESLRKLQKIEKLNPYKEHMDLFKYVNQINNYRMSKDDTQINQYVAEIDRKIEQGKIEGLKEDLDKTLNDLKRAAPAIRAVNQIIRELEVKAAKSTFGKSRIKNKIREIKNALNNLSFEDRANLEESKNPVLEAIAKHRHAFRKTVTVGEKGQVMGGKETQSFKRFKEILTQEKEKEKTNRDETEGSSSSESPK